MTQAQPAPSPLSEQASDMLTAWFQSPQFKTTFEGPDIRRISDAQFIALSQASSKAFGIPASWAMPPESHFHSYDSNFFLRRSMASSGSAEAVKSCAASGIDPWLTHSRIHVDPERKQKWNHQYRFSFRLIPPQAMANIAASCPTIAACASLAKCAASHAASHGAEHACAFVSELCDIVVASAQASLQGAAGVMGERDRQAKRCAQLLLSCEAELSAIATSDLAKSKLVSSIARAKALHEAKSKPAAFDPAKYKKSLTPDKRERLLSIISLALRSSCDDGAAAMVVDGTPWLAQEPNALAVGIKSHASALSCALSEGGPATLAAIESAGANIWIASAQEGESNACLWAACRFCHRPESPACSTVARMLAYGAHLDGASDPVQYALDKLAEARANPPTHYEHVFPQICERFKSELESIAFSQLLAERAEDAQEREAAASRPRRHRL